MSAMAVQRRSDPSSSSQSSTEMESVQAVPQAHRNLSRVKDVSFKTPHPRRPIAAQSVSLMHTPASGIDGQTSLRKRDTNSLAASMRAEPRSTSSPKPAYQSHSSGESSNAEKWFEASNNKVRASSAPLGGDNEPPFLLRNPSSSESRDVEDAHIVTSHAASSNFAHLANLGYLPTLASSSEDFRSVIDDLTIQNKKLKRKLKKYERLQDSHLQEEKLFEVRVHSLPANKKRELEEMLKKFVLTCEDGYTDRASSGRGFERAGAPLMPRKTTSSHTSTRFGDSAYASMSASGQNSSNQSGQHGFSQSAQASSSGNRQASHQKYAQQRHDNVRSYLHDIPIGLLPRNPVGMSEKAKRKMVVRRLEQVFAGKAYTNGGHQQPIQQQEVSQSAARADRRAVEASGQIFPEEGAREARIMNKTHTRDANQPPAQNADEHTDASGEGNVEEHDFADGGISEPVEQRPTRPLDLDPFRAQVPAENIRYIRHLGFSPLDAGSAGPHEDGHGWIYLNVLTNMAQLHTINVTSDFIKSAITDNSHKLELSPDGRKVRWRGGTNVTRTSTDSSPDDDNRVGNTANKNEPRQRSKLATTVSSSGGTSSESAAKPYFQTQQKDRFAYTPLFFHKEQESEDEDMSEEENITSASSPALQVAGDSSGFTSSGVRTTSSRKKRGDDGPIIFYNRAKFCTDLSGDVRGKGLATINNMNYGRLPVTPIGVIAESVGTEAGETRGPLSMAQIPPFEEANDSETTPSTDLNMDIEMGDQRSVSKSSNDDNRSPYPFEASGVGGVVPVDNFAIRVKSQRKVKTAVSPMHQQHGRAIPPMISKLLAEGNAAGGNSFGSTPQRFIEEEIISERCKNLPPSELPPPSFLPFDSTPTDDEDDDASDIDMDNSGDEDTPGSHASHDARLLPAAAPQLINWPTLDSEEEEDSNGSEDGLSDEDDEGADDSSSGGSLDLLAHAREVDPAAIRAREREYDSHMAERLAEEIPAGSSAATAGGGSGFNSPSEKRDALALAAAAAGGKEGDAATKAQGLKRSRTSDNMVAAAEQAFRARKSPRTSRR